MNRLARLLLAVAPLSACATAPRVVPVAAPVAVIAPATDSATPEEARAKLLALFKASDEASLRLNPLDALFRGDMRYADQFGDTISDDYFAATRTAAERDLAALEAIDRALLNPTDQIAYDTFAFSTRDALKRLD